MFCKVCGRSIQREDNFCSGCGTAIAQEPFKSAATVGSSAIAGTPTVPAAAVEMQEPLVLAGNQASLPAAEPVRADPKSDSPQEQGITGSPDASPSLTREEPASPPPQAALTVRQFRRCP